MNEVAGAASEVASAPPGEQEELVRMRQERDHYREKYLELQSALAASEARTAELREEVREAYSEERNTRDCLDNERELLSAAQAEIARLRGLLEDNRRKLIDGATACVPGACSDQGTWFALGWDACRREMLTKLIALDSSTEDDSALASNPTTALTETKATLAELERNADG